MDRWSELIVVGSGLAGMSAALEASLSGIKTVVFSMPSYKGYWYNVPEVPFYSGGNKKVSGAEFLGDMRRRAEAGGAIFIEASVEEIRKTAREDLAIVTGGKGIWESRFVIIASGLIREGHGLVPGELELFGRGVYYFFPDLLPDVHGKHVAVFGKNERAANAAIFLSRRAASVYFVIPGLKIDADEKLVREVESKKNISLIYSSSLRRFNGTSSLTSVTILEGGSEKELAVSTAVVCAQNLIPSISYAKGVVATDELGRVLVGEDFSTSNPSIFAAGDVLCGEIQHPAVSMAQGVIAALGVKRALANTRAS